YIQEAGGTLNGSTSLDRTNYFETIPSNSLELALWLESDRMGLLIPALTKEKLQNQKDVVMNERRQRYENQPYGLAWETLFSNLFPKDHPYSWPTIGWMEDIKKFQLSDVKKFFKTYYAPNNASLVVVGDIEYGKTIRLVEDYFGEFPKGNSVPEIYVPETSLTENKLITLEDNVQLSRLYLAWHSDKLYGNNDATLDILSEILSGSKNSRLFKSLVFDKQIAQDISTFQYSAKQTGMFIIVATVKPGHSIEEVKETIINEIKKIGSKSIMDEELSRALNSLKSSYIFSLQKQSSLADQINNYNCNLGEPNSFIFDLDRYARVTKQSVAVVKEIYLDKPFIELHVVPKIYEN
ncbi:MAG: insulinase family protein, partial [Ignavibacteriales bacterium]